MPFQLIRGDLLAAKTEAIVNAANEALRCYSQKPGEGGVCGAIFAAADRARLEAACAARAPCPTGKAALTEACGLPFRAIIHAVGPVWQGGNAGEEGLLASAYREALRLCRQEELRSVAFPLLSAGLFGYPPEQALRVATQTILRFLDTEDPEGTLLVQLVLRDPALQTSRDTLLQRVLRGGELKALRLGLLNAPASRVEDIQSAPMPPHAAERARDAIRAGKEYRIPSDSFLCRIRSNARRAVREEETFSDCLLRLIDERGEKDAEVYKRANIDRRVFSKIRSDRQYHPSKSTALAFCLSLRLSLPEAAQLLSCAGLAFSGADLRDQVVRRCLEAEVYDVFDVNSILFDLDLPGLGL